VAFGLVLHFLRFRSPSQDRFRVNAMIYENRITYIEG
jgi:hypothetical protein